MSLLKLSHVSAFYGPSQALFDVTFRVEPGEVESVLGPRRSSPAAYSKTIEGAARLPPARSASTCAQTAAAMSR